MIDGFGVNLTLLWRIYSRPPPVANPFSTMRASLRWWPSDEFENGVAHGWQSRLRWWPADSYFSSCCYETVMLEQGVSDNRHFRPASGNYTTGANFRPVTREPDPRIRRKKEESSQDDGLLGQARQ
ncbi:MAG: hypothetical protein K8H87_09985 [Pseudorhodoplanes sp.]|nr:hypothetical protein [Pseudorhodoplanes sp.]